MKASILTALVLFSLAVPYTARADCAMGTVAGMKRWAALVFEGTVVKIDRVEEDNEAAATLRVHRVWKGHVTEQMTMYYTGSSEGPVFEVGTRRVVFALLLNPITQQSYDGWPPHAPAGAAWVPPCSGPLALSEAGLKQLGRSRKPLALPRHNESQQTGSLLSASDISARIGSDADAKEGLRLVLTHAAYDDVSTIADRAQNQEHTLSPVAGLIRYAAKPTNFRVVNRNNNHLCFRVGLFDALDGSRHDAAGHPAAT